MTSKSDPLDEDMPAEVDFTGGIRGVFYRPNATLNLPSYADPELLEVQAINVLDPNPNPSGFGMLKRPRPSVPVDIDPASLAPKPGGLMDK